MAPKWIELGSVLYLLAIFSAGAMAQSGCNSVLISMASCLNYVTGSAATPPPACCSALENVVKTQPQCLCTIVNSGGGSLGVNLNQTRAIELPSVCSIDTPPVSRCSDVNDPAMSPVDSPELSPAGSPTSPTTPSVTGSKTVPSNAVATKGNTTMINLQLLAMFLVIIASYASSYNYF